MLELGVVSQAIIEKTHKYSANHYHRLPVVVVKGEGTRVWDAEGREYIDMLSCYSALTPDYAEFVEQLAKFCFLDKVLPLNSGAEAVETAIKVARKWGYKVKGVKRDKAEIIVCQNNFHGRTTCFGTIAAPSGPTISPVPHPSATTSSPPFVG